MNARSQPPGGEDQLEFGWDPGAPRARWTAQSLHRALEARSGLELDMTITANTSSILHFRPRSDGGGGRLRLHGMFLHAEPDVVEALAHWVRRPRKGRHADRIDGFIQAHGHLIAPRQPRPVRIRTQGRHFDLTELFEEVNRAHFGGAVKAAITWGPRTATGRRSIRLGAYSERAGLIRVHPVLDQSFVPRYFVRYIVFHEMLHAHLGVGTGPTGRRRIHPPEFKRLEQAYPGYGRAVAWQETHIGHLLRSRSLR